MIKRFPNLNGLLWNGIPFSSIVRIESGLITYPSSVATLNLVPSRKSTVKLIPHKAYTRVISFDIKRSAPFLLKIACFYCATTKTTSPASFFGCSSASPWNVNFYPSGEPLSIVHSNTFLSLRTLLPLQTVHLLLSGIVSPLPPHISQSTLASFCIPGPINIYRVSLPVPPHGPHC